MYEVGKKMMARVIACPRCGAKPGEPCTTDAGNQHGSNHRERYVRYESLALSPGYTSAMDMPWCTVETERNRAHPSGLKYEDRHLYPVGSLVELSRRERLWVLGHGQGKFMFDKDTSFNVGAVYTLGTLNQPLVHGVANNHIARRIDIEGDVQ